MMTSKNLKRLDPLLKAFYQKPTLDRITQDPISIPRRYQDRFEIEAVGWLTASFAYGRAPLFNDTVEKILQVAGKSFYRYLQNFDLNKDRHKFDNIYYRFNHPKEILGLIYLMSQVVQCHGGIYPLFLSCYRDTDTDISPTLSRFIEKIRKIDTSPIFGKKEKPSGLLQFLPSPEDGSACKRLNLYLRWMIRPNDGIDFGLWKEIPPFKLIIPLDTHIIRIGQYIRLTSRKTADLKMATEITQSLKQIDQFDPVKYDFSLCHHGISQNCPLDPSASKCRQCILQPACKRGVAVLKKSGIIWNMP
jgi:uncharacterized protein (TIGR02757 family)